MKQHSLGLGQTTKRTRRREFLDEMEKVVPWADLVALVSPFLPEGKRGRPPFSPETMLRIHFMQQWFALSDPAMEEALHDMPVFREFAGLEGWDERLPDEHDPAVQACAGEAQAGRADPADRQRPAECQGRDAQGWLGGGCHADRCAEFDQEQQRRARPEMKQSRKGQQWYFGMKCHIGVDIESGLVHTVRGTSGAVNDVTEANSLVRPSDREVYADAGYRGADKRPDARAGVSWNIAMRPGKRRTLDQTKPIEALTEQLEKVKAGIRARVEHPFRVIKRQFGHIKVRYRGLAKNTAQLHTLFALANLWMARRKLIGAVA
jgi:IS5 family transposase